MKFLAIVILTLSFCVLADHHEEGKAKGFEQAKTMKMANIDKRIESLNTLKSCVSAAADRDAMKACHKANKERMKALKKENKKRRREMKKMRIERRKARKGKGKDDDASSDD